MLILLHAFVGWGAGNHDSEIAEDRRYQMKLLQSLPYSLAEPGPLEVEGVGNCKSRPPAQRVQVCLVLTRFVCVFSSLVVMRDWVQTLSKSDQPMHPVSTYSHSTSSTLMPSSRESCPGSGRITITLNRVRSSGTRVRARRYGL